MILICLTAVPATAQNFHGVIVGINEFDVAPSLAYAVADAQAMKETLINDHSWSSSNIEYRTDENAVKNTILYLIEELPHGSSDIDLYYQASHGDSEEYNDGTDGLVPHDDDDDRISPSEVQDSFYYNYTQFSVILDACFTGLFVEDMTRGEILSAVTKDSIAYEFPWLGHGQFTYHILEALGDSLAVADTSSDGSITVEELYNYVKDRCRPYYPYDWQNPQFKDAHTGPLFLTPPPVPSAPSSLEITEGEEQNPELDWEGSSGYYIKYNIYRKEYPETSFSKIATTSSTSYTDTEIEMVLDTGDPVQYYIKAENAGGESGASNTATVYKRDKVSQFGKEILPDKYYLDQNYPNPFNPVTTIRFQLPEARYVKLVVYDITGREVARLMDQNMSAGFHAVEWDGSNSASGLYFYKISAGRFSVVKRMLLVK
jgi:hypothetical protein